MNKKVLILIILAIIVGCNNQKPMSSDVEKPSVTQSPNVMVESKETTKPSPDVTPAVHTETPIPTPTVIPTPIANTNHREL